MIPLTLPAWLAPVTVPSVRLGSANDGGYVMPAHLLTDADALLSMGLATNWTFEQQARALNPRLEIHAYDHTVSLGYLRKDYLLYMLSAMVGQAPWSIVARRRKGLQDYRAFFGPHATHFQERIYSHTEPGSVTIDTAMQRLSGRRVFVKMDIEGAEYRVMNTLLAHADRLTGLAVECHDTGPLWASFEALIAPWLSRFAIVHVHVNNFAPLYQGRPDVLELTLARRDLIDAAGTQRTLPVALDQPNDPHRPDFAVTFE